MFSETGIILALRFTGNCAHHRGGKSIVVSSSGCCRKRQTVVVVTFWQTSGINDVGFMTTIAEIATLILGIIQEETFQFHK